MFLFCGNYESAYSIAHDVIACKDYFPFPDESLWGNWEFANGQNSDNKKKPAGWTSGGVAKKGEGKIFRGGFFPPPSSVDSFLEHWKDCRHDCQFQLHQKHISITRTHWSRRKVKGINKVARIDARMECMLYSYVFNQSSIGRITKTRQQAKSLLYTMEFRKGFHYSWTKGEVETSRLDHKPF